MTVLLDTINPGWLFRQLDNQQVSKSFFKYWPLVERLLHENLPLKESLSFLNTFILPGPARSDRDASVVCEFWRAVCEAASANHTCLPSLGTLYHTGNPIARIARDLPDHAAIVALAYNQPLRHQLKPDEELEEKSELSISVGQIMHEFLQHVARSGTRCKPYRVALGSSDADFDPRIADRNGQVKPCGASYTLQRTRTTADDYARYKAVCNDLLSPLLHMTHGILEHYSHFLNFCALPSWGAFERVNQALADSAFACLKDASLPLVQLHDFEVCLVGHMVRQALPEARITYFGHVAWPEPEFFRLLPDEEVRRKILRGILGCDVVAFHTRKFADNFLQCVNAELSEEARITADGVSYRGRNITVAVNPLGIDCSGAIINSRFDKGAVSEADTLLFGREQCLESKLVCLSAERTDFTKGSLERLQALHEMLCRHPELAAKVRFVQVLVPSRQYLPSYRRQLDFIREATVVINQQFQNPDERPLVTTLGPLPHAVLLAAMASADLFWVNSLNDGLSLTAKEYVAVRGARGLPGTLILSKQAGAAAELDDAVLIDPLDTAATGDVLLKAIGDFKSKPPLCTQRLYHQVWQNCLTESLAPLFPRAQCTFSTDTPRA